MARVGCVLVITLCVVLANSHEVSALTQFRKSFQEKYVEKHKSEGFKTLVKKTKCNLCHVKGEKKTVRNEYGKELAKLIEGDAYERIKAVPGAERRQVLAGVLKELDVAFKKVEKMKSKSSGEIYGVRMKAGKLPFVPKPEDDTLAKGSNSN